MARKYIDADILLKNITDHHYLIVSYSNSTDYGMFTTGIKQAIDELPTADVQEVKHGKWEVGYFRDRVCSRCCHPSNDLSDFAYDFCPNCGARMDGDV